MPYKIVSGCRQCGKFFSFRVLETCHDMLTSALANIFDSGWASCAFFWSMPNGKEDVRTGIRERERERERERGIPREREEERGKCLQQQ